jgi:hypothetical protein
VMTWTNYELERSLERDFLQQALPLLPTQANGSSRATVDLSADRADVAVAVTKYSEPLRAVASSFSVFGHYW